MPSYSPFSRLSAPSRNAEPQSSRRWSTYDVADDSAPEGSRLEPPRPSAIIWLSFAVLLAIVGPTAIAAQEIGAGGFTSVWTVPEDVTINAEECADDITFTVGWSLDMDPATDQEIFVTTSTDEECSPEVEEVDERSATRGEDSAEVRAQQVLPECPEVDGEDRWVCVRLAPVAGAEAGVSVSAPVFVDTVAPEPPDELTAQPADEAINLEWSWTEARPEDLAAMTIYYREAEDAGEPQTTSAAGAVSEARVTGLRNGVEYELWVSPVDEVGNEGEESARVLETPQETVGFWELYREQGGAETGGCSGSGPQGRALLALLLLTGGLVVFRARFSSRRGRAAAASSACVALLACAALPNTAAADVPDYPDSEWFFELELGPYLPEVDDELDDASPYRDVFGSSSNLMVRLRADRALWQEVGQLALGASTGFSRASGKALYADGSQSPDPAAFNWVPFDLSLTYRFDYTVAEWGIPLVPYARAGLNATTWWVSGPDGISVDDEGNRALGVRTGFFYGGGLKFLLNVIDPRLAADFRRNSGVKHTYLYLDVTRKQINGFGTDGFDLSDTTWFLGLSFEI